MAVAHSLLSFLLAGPVWAPVALAEAHCEARCAVHCEVREVHE